MREGLIQHRQRPTSVENSFRRFIGRGFVQVPSLRLRLVERKEGSAAAAFGRLAAVVFVDQETIQRGQQKGTKPALMRIKICKPVLFEQPRKKFLREVLRIFWSVAPLPYIRIEGVPVGA